jgi:hypothetical protein
MKNIYFEISCSDRSGTMDFDEFATWIMSAEFRPNPIKKKPKTPKEELGHEEYLRRKLAECIKEHKEVFALMKKKINFMELISDVNRKNMKLSERDARDIFIMFDPQDTGFIDSKSMQQWALTGIFYILC